MNDKISIVIPAHNAEKTVLRAIRSIHDSLSGMIPYEVIVVENGSTDLTWNVLKNQQIERIKLLRSSAGVSNARNIGMAAADGKWLMFVDADDMLETGCGKYLKEQVERDMDLCLFGYSKGKQSVFPELKNGETVEQIRVKMLEFPTKYMTVWAKLFRRDIIEKNRLEFDDDLRLSEDSDFVARYTKYCRKIICCERLLYCYEANADSVMHVFDGRKLLDYAKAMEVTQKKLIDESEPIKNAYWQYVLTHFHVAMVNEVFSTANKRSLLQKNLDMKKAAMMPIFRKSIQKTKGQEQSKANRILGALLRKKCYLCAAGIYEARALQKGRSAGQKIEENG